MTTLCKTFCPEGVVASKVLGLVEGEDLEEPEEIPE